MHVSATSFRLGATSYVYPGDLVHNATRLAGQVQDIELVLYVTPTGESNLPTPSEVTELARIAADAGLTYTVHLPRDLRGHEGPDGVSLALASEVVELRAPLNPHAYVMHADGRGVGTTAWTAQAVDALTQMVQRIGDPQRIALENLESYAPEHLLPLFDALPIARTLDIGHLWKAGIDPLPLIDQWRGHARVMHIHGVRTRGVVTEDHGTLAWMASAPLGEVLARLQGWNGVLTLEVFEDDFFTSRSVLADALAQLDFVPGNATLPRPI